MTTAAKAKGQRRSPKGERRRAALLDATLMVAAESGMDGATIGTVATAASTPKSLVLYHFESRDGLLTAAVAQAVDVLSRERHQHMAIAGGDPKEQLGAWIAALYSSPTVLQAWCVLTQVNGRTSPGPGLSAVAEHERLVLAEMEELIDRGNDEFCWQVPSSAAAARAVVAMLDGLRLSMLRQGFDADPVRAAAQSRRAVLDYLLG